VLEEKTVKAKPGESQPWTLRSFFRIKIKKFEEKDG
jgi:hypothetical protein